MNRLPLFLKNPFLEKRITALAVNIFFIFFVQIGLILLLGSEDGHEVLRTEDFRMTDYEKKRITICESVIISVWQ